MRACAVQLHPHILHTAPQKKNTTLCQSGTSGYFESVWHFPPLVSRENSPGQFKQGNLSNKAAGGPPRPASCCFCHNSTTCNSEAIMCMAKRVLSCDHTHMVAHPHFLGDAINFEKLIKVGCSQINRRLFRTFWLRHNS